jgi:cyclopropane fatty-acyl-phospholipid synthase-like methyltransferase
MLAGVADPDDLNEAAYSRMRWNTALSVAHAELLLDRLDLRAGQRIADLGCGWGELLLTAVARAGAGASGIGVDSDVTLLDRGRQQAARRGLAVEFAEADAAGWRGAVDRALCVGASHAFGGTRAALTTLAEVVPAGGRLLFGDAFWEREPSEAAFAIFGDALAPLPALLEAVRAAGWRVIHLSAADQREWDDFESSFRAGRQEWLLANPGHPKAAQIRDWLDQREREYVEAYRGVAGLAYLVLAH